MTVALVVDDEPQIRMVLAEVCAEMGLEVRQARDGVAALEVLEQGGVDLILLDLSMPRLDGHGVLLRLKELKLSPRPGVVLVTADAEAAGRIRGADLGALDSVIKPFRLPEMRRRLERVLGIVDLERRLESAEESLRSVRGRDPVTGAGTFSMLCEALETQFQNARFTGGELSCIVVSDERFNERQLQLGMEKSGERLQRVASRIEKLLRGADQLFRIDAAEFVLLLPGAPAGGARRVVDRVLETLAEEGFTGDDDFAVAAVTYPHPEITQASLLFRAVNVTLAQVRARETKRPGYFEGF